MDLKTILNEFIKVIESSPENLGNLKALTSHISINTTLPLDSDLHTYFEFLNLDSTPVIGCYFHMILFGPNDLIGALQGWRWIQTKSGKIEVDRSRWNPAWIIIADRNGDAIFVDTDNHKVFGSIQGENLLIAEDLLSFFSALTDATKIEKEKYDFNVRTESLTVLTEFEADVRKSIFTKLGQEAASGFMEFFFG